MHGEPYHDFHIFQAAGLARRLSTRIGNGVKKADHYLLLRKIIVFSPSHVRVDAPGL